MDAVSDLRTFDDFADKAVDWNETSIRLLHEMEGCFLYEVLEYRGDPVTSGMPKHERYGVASWVPEESNWSAWDCHERVFAGYGTAATFVPPRVLDTFRKLYELLP